MRPGHPKTRKKSPWAEKGRERTKGQDTWSHSEVWTFLYLLKLWSIPKDQLRLDWQFRISRNPRYNWSPYPLEVFSKGIYQALIKTGGRAEDLCASYSNTSVWGLPKIENEWEYLQKPIYSLDVLNIRKRLAQNLLWLESF